MHRRCLCYGSTETEVLSAANNNDVGFGFFQLIVIIMRKMLFLYVDCIIKNNIFRMSWSAMKYLKNYFKYFAFHNEDTNKLYQLYKIHIFPKWYKNISP